MNGDSLKRESSLTEENQTHTPGPWHIQPVTAEFRRPNEDGAHDLCIVAENGLCPGIVWEYRKEGEANARLIAAAPDMANALRRALSWLSSYQGNGAKGAYMDAVNALKKAGCYD